MLETPSHLPPGLCSNLPPHVPSLPILAGVLGVLLLEPASPGLSPIHLGRLLLFLLGGTSCIGGLLLVLPLLFDPDPHGYLQKR